MDDLIVEAVLLDIERIELPLLNRFYADWRDLCRGRFAPSRADIDPTKFAYILPRVLMFDVVDEGRDFRVRLAGSATYGLHGQDVTGMLLSDFQPPAFRDSVMASYRQIVRDRRPLYVRNAYRQYDAEVNAYHVLRLPLSNDGERVNIILIGEDYSGHEGELMKIMTSA